MPGKANLLLRRTNDIRLKNKLMISFILVVFIPVMIVGVFLTVQYRQTVLKQATQQTLNNVDKIKTRTSNILRMPIEISNNLLVDKRLTRVVNTDYESTFEQVKAFWDYTDFKEHVRAYQEIHNIRFYTNNPTMMNNWDFLHPDEAVQSSFWYKEAMELKKDNIGWYFIPDETKGNQRFLSLVRKINFPEYRTNGLVVIDFDQDELNDIVKQEPFDTMIFDARGIVVAAKDTSWVGRDIGSLDFARNLLDKPKGTYEMVVDGKPSKLVIEELLPGNSHNGLKIVSVFAIASIAGEAERISKLGFTIIIISLVIAVVLIYFTSSFLTRRLLLLNKVLSKVALGDLNVTSTVDGGDEVGLLARQFNHMVASIRGLMHEVAESHRQQSRMALRQREIKLKMMASQINPHFLYNALESIRMKAHVKGETEIAYIVKLLGKLMRRSIEIGARRIELREELEIVRYYLEIQKFRYGDGRLTFEIEADEDSLQVYIPPLIIQPLVENAVVHGLDNVEFGGFVRISARLMDGCLQVLVADNGTGIEKERLEEIESSLKDMEEEETYRIGLRNVHQRLVLSYGEQVGLRIDSGAGTGTRISFRVPAGGAGSDV
ncbi:sensor histidine kinase [Gorillibacterium sp. sgz5001074]|uniref:sensor histidine kinase n=1 Tax=Gorillibacterium sp. sgz5001074 TaxID=3446695 RepID=UPI003F67E544